MSRSALLMPLEDIKYIAAIKDNNKIITKIDALRGDESKVDALRGDESNVDALHGDVPISDTNNSRKKDAK